MGHLNPVSDAEASGPVRESFDAARKLLGGVPDALRVLAHDPRALALAVERLQRALGPDGASIQAMAALKPGTAGAALKGAVAMAAAIASRSDAGAYANALRKLGFDDKALLDITETVKTIIDLETAQPGGGPKPSWIILLPIPIEED